MSISALQEYQAAQRRKTIDAIERAKKEIEHEMAQFGYYPHNGGRLSKLETLRRAGVSPQTLKNETHAETAASLARWIGRIKNSAPTLKPEADDAKSNKIRNLEHRLNAVVAHYDRFKLEYNELLHRCETLETENAALRDQIVGTTRSNVVALKLNR